MFPICVPVPLSFDWKPWPEFDTTWCSAECKEHFSEVHGAKLCAEYRTIAAIDAVLIAYAISRQSSKAIMVPTDETVSSYIAPSKLSGWTDYHNRIIPMFDLGISLFAKQFEKAHPDVERALGLVATESSSIPLTLLSALEETLPDLPARRKLCIHIVGAAQRELLSTGMMEELLHYLPRLKSVTIVYVGPEVYSGDDAPNLACSDCQNAGRSRVIIRCAVPYHDFAASPAYSINPPDLVAAFNTGLSEMEVALWAPSLKVILYNRVPALFTAYTMTEATRDVMMLGGLGASFFKDLEVNKWRGVVLQEPFQVHSSGTSIRKRLVDLAHHCKATSPPMLLTELE